MKRLAFLFSFFLLVSSSQASHLKGGYINYKCVSGRSYQITLVTFSDPNSPADINTSNAFIFFGDGDSLTIQRTQRVAVSVNLVENIYITTHTYVSDGNFLINFTDFSFVDGIVNVNGGDSKNQQFYIESFLKINSTIGAFNSPEPHSILPDLRAIGGKELYYNSTWFGRSKDHPNDSISFELSSMKNINNFTLPPGLSIDNYSGMIKWEKVPIVSGSIPILWLINYKVLTYRLGVLVGYTTVAQIARVDNFPGSFPSIINFPFCDSTNNSWYKKNITANNFFKQEFNYTDNNYQFLKRVYGETNLSMTDSSLSSISKTIINFISDTNLVQRTRPYFYTIRIIKDSSTGIPYFRDYNLAVYYGASTYFGINEVEDNDKYVNVFPNPTNGVFEININTIDANSIRVMDITGKLMFERKITSLNESIDMTGFPKGVYVLYISGNNFSINKKLILE
jgi:hypothetical protein